MHRESIWVCALLVLAASGVVIGGEDADSEEVHLVGVYEGYETTGTMIHGPRATVHVDRPGKRVTLVLTSYSGATWCITASDDTDVHRVILGGYEAQAAEGLPESTEIIRAWRGASETPLSSSRYSEGPGFRQLVTRIYALTETELSSFYGVYQAPRTPIVIDEVDDDPRLSVDYPRTTPLGELPADMREIRFLAHHYIAGNSSIGQFSVAGPMARTLKPLPRRVTRVTYDPDGEMYYGISGHDVVQVDVDSGEVKPLELGLNVPRLSWPCEITYDTERKRVILGSSGGGGYLYAYSPQEEQWSVICERPGAFDAFTYSPEDDLLYGVFFDYSERGNVASFGTVNPNGAVVSRFQLGPPIEPGSLNTGPGVCTTQVAIAGNYVVILATPGGPGGRNKGNTTFVYLVDPDTEQVWLTSKEPVGERMNRGHEPESE